ncbi:MAG: TIGR00701 family protein [Legionellales bacterium RIFCSPHIGHO2_12_FULL_35_11]|nr:MAG: TIGR00701 family protein [Legionellales bacterium RIFCSPHIGHO2_12_FULL_35_11]
MLIIKSFHIIAMVAWFAGLFYLPRLFVYHAEAQDEISIARFKIMERRLFYAITTPAGILTIILGIFLIGYNFDYYLHAYWMHAKLLLVILLVVYHIMCWCFLGKFKNNANKLSSKFYRYFNELPTIALICIVLLVVMKPF